MRPLRYWGSEFKARGRVASQPRISLTTRGTVYSVLHVIDGGERPKPDRMHFKILLWTEFLALQVVSLARPGMWCEVEGHFQTRPRELDIPEMQITGELVSLWVDGAWKRLFKRPQAADVIPSTEALLA